MKRKDKGKAEKILRHMCLGAQIDGVHFGMGFGILFHHFNNPALLSYESMYLTIETNFVVLPTAPLGLPHVAQLTLSERLSVLGSLQGQQIVDVRLGETSPHLLLTFNSGSTIF